MKRDLPLSLWSWCAVILVASFMPWATNAVNFVFSGNVSLIATGWTGNTTLLGVVVPNWVAVALAAALAIISWLQTATQIDPKVSFRIALAGLIHSLFFIFLVVFDRGTHLGLGAVANLFAFAAILRLLKKKPVAVESSHATAGI